MALTLADRIVEAIPDTEYTTFAELQRKLGAKKSTLSEALRKLESTGVVEKRTEGKTVFVRRAKARPLSKIFADSDIVAEAPLAPRIFGGPMSRLGGPCVVRPINAYVRVGLRTIAEDPKPHLKFRTISVLDPLSGLTRRIDEDIQRFEFYPFEIIRTHSEKKRLRFHSYEANVETAFDSGCGLGINAALNVAFILAICFDLGEIQSKEPFQNEADRKVLHKMSYWLEQKTYTRRFAPAPSTEQTSEQSPPSSGASVHCSILGSSRGMFYHYEAPSKPKVSAEPNAVVSLPVDTDPLDLVVGERKRQWIIPENPLFPDGDLSKHVLPLWTSLERKFEDSLSRYSLGEYLTLQKTLLAQNGLYVVLGRDNPEITSFCASSFLEAEVGASTIGEGIAAAGVVLSATDEEKLANRLDRSGLKIVDKGITYSRARPATIIKPNHTKSTNTS